MGNICGSTPDDKLSSGPPNQGDVGFKNSDDTKKSMDASKKPSGKIMFTESKNGVKESKQQEEVEVYNNLICCLPVDDAIKKIDFTNKQWIETKVKQEGIEISGYNQLIAGTQNQLYMIGGNGPANDEIYEVIETQEQGEGTSITYTFNKKSSSLNQKRCFQSLGWYKQQQYIVVSGGFDVDGDILSSCELYDIEEDALAQLPPLNTARIYHTTISISDTIYVFCGSEGGNNDSDSIEKLSKPLDQGSEWEVVNLTSSQELTACLNPGVIGLDHSNKVLVFGGFKGSTQSLIFDTEKEELTSSETQLPKEAEFKCNQVVRDRNTNTVYCVDEDGSNFFQYDIGKEQWTEIKLEEK